VDSTGTVRKGQALPNLLKATPWLRHKELEKDLDVSSVGASLYLGAEASITWSAGNTSRGKVLIEDDRLRVSYVASTAVMIYGPRGDLDRLMGNVLTRDGNERTAMSVWKTDKRQAPGSARGQIQRDCAELAAP
jgi:hypothetical protein